ncbi:beta-xylosidase, partial [bacterium F16]
VTQGIQTSYFYSRYFDSIESVGRYSLENFDDIKKRAQASDDLISAPHLSDDQRFHLIHAIRSYYGSTQMLDNDGEPIWVVNEGEYRMMNTFDLTVDQLFYELKLNPWTVKNELDLFTSRYSYTDKVHFPGGDNDHPGGLSFTHDMGQRNVFSRPGYSCYERAGLHGCFSYMTHEQLVNWVLCAAMYVKTTSDQQWLKDNLAVFEQCLESLLNRDNPVESERNGIMGLDSSRTIDGTEITTYDSLDESLGQSRNNLYMAVKGWASYLALTDLFNANGLKEKAEIAARQAKLAAETIVSFQTPEGYIPAVMGEDSDSKIIPGIEGLVFPFLMGYTDAVDEHGEFGKLIQVLKQHLESILKEGDCLYPDGGWKLSSTADNSWLSKIYLCQYVARQILGLRTDATGKTADAAHKRWLLKDENLEFAWSDQMKSGVARGSKYYPRGVTSILWCNEDA